MSLDPGLADDRSRWAALENRGIVRHRHWGRQITGLVVLAGVLWLAWGLITHHAFDWPTFDENLLNSDVLEGVWLTFWLTTVVSVLGFLLGTLLAVMRLSGVRMLSAVGAGYVWFFRSVPVLVQLLLWYNIGYIIPVIHLGLPFAQPFLTVATHQLISATGAAILGLTLSESAHAAEIVRGGILSVSPGTIEAGATLGLTPMPIFRRIVLPQAMPAILPAAGYLVIGTLKGTSIVSVIAVSDLLYSTQLISYENYKIVPLLMVATAWYLVATTLLSFAQGLLENRFALTKRSARPKAAGSAMAGQA